MKVDHEALLAYYENDWRRVLWDATGDQRKVDRVIELARLNGLFDPVMAARERCRCGYLDGTCDWPACPPVSVSRPQRSGAAE